jgi:hypothetical protein
MRLVARAVAGVLVLSAGCTCAAEIASDDGGVLPDGAVVGELDVGAGRDALVVGGCVMAACQTHLYACGNCADDDGDGLVDSDDPDCLGPCHNREDGFELGIPGGDSRPCALDCYYDQDEGPGNDQCTWDHRCDPLGPDPAPLCMPRDPPPADAMCPPTQPTACHDFCGPLTPNGCDCFGCCNLPAGSAQYVFIGSVDGSGAPTCDLASVGDPARCRPCTPVGDCLNDCGRCELCLGRTTLPAECTPQDGSSPDAGVGERCAPGVQVCGLPGEPDCPSGSYCVTGCCIYLG